jgi:hypothetical protein
VTILLIAFSLLYNYVPVGLTIFLVHDASDWLRGFSYVMGDSRACILHPRLALLTNVAHLVVFGYMRLGVLPFCLIESMQSGNPSLAGEEWAFVWPQWACMTVLSYAIYCIQCYWSYFIFSKLKQEHQRNQHFVQQYQAITHPRKQE